MASTSTDPNLKWCRACEDFHLKTEFYRDVTMTDGLMSVCMKEMKDRRELRRDSGANRAASRKYAKTKKGIERQKARNAVMAALRKGWIKKPAHCQFGEAINYSGLTWHLSAVDVVFKSCFETKIEHHHYKGYSEREHLTIIWLCSRHHALLETEER